MMFIKVSLPFPTRTKAEIDLSTVEVEDMAVH
jgi:hypothetical protein